MKEITKENSKGWSLIHTIKWIALENSSCILAGACKPGSSLPSIILHSLDRRIRICRWNWLGHQSTWWVQPGVAPCSHGRVIHPPSVWWKSTPWTLKTPAPPSSGSLAPTSQSEMPQTEWWGTTNLHTQKAKELGYIQRRWKTNDTPILIRHNGLHDVTGKNHTESFYTNLLTCTVKQPRWCMRQP